MAKKMQPHPWMVQCRQYDGKTGKSSRARLLDANGKPLSLSNVRQATLAAMAPVLLERLEKLTMRAEMLHLQVQSALAISIPVPAELADAREAVDVGRRI